MSTVIETMEEFRRHTIPLDILDELAARFIINIPQEERRDLIRVCFQIEAAHWFYIDFYVDSASNKKLKPDQRLQAGTMKEFAAHIFIHVPFLQSHANRVEEVMEEWREYKLAVPTFGAIIINTFLDKVLLVQGYMAKSSWGFPKGKVNEDEPPHLCAAREVLEETGFDVGPLIEEDEYLEQVINDQTVRLYLVTGVPESTSFAPQTRCEIRDLQWFDINTLPINRSDMVCKTKLGIAANSFFMVIPFVRDLKIWVKNKQKNRLEFQGMDGKLRTKIADRLKKKSENSDRPGKGKVEGGGSSRVNSGKKNSDASHNRRDTEPSHQAAGKQRRDSEKNPPSVGRQRKESEDKHPMTNVPVGRQRKESEKNQAQCSTGKQKKLSKKNSRTEENMENSRKHTEQVMTNRFWKGDGEYDSKPELLMPESRSAVNRSSVPGMINPSEIKQEKKANKQSRRQLNFNDVIKNQEGFTSIAKDAGDRDGRRVKNKNSNKNQILKPLFDDNFIPAAWKNFSLDYNKILAPFDENPSMTASNYSASIIRNHPSRDISKANSGLPERSLRSAFSLPTGYAGGGQIAQTETLMAALGLPSSFGKRREQ